MPIELLREALAVDDSGFLARLPRLGWDGLVISKEAKASRGSGERDGDSDGRVHPAEPLTAEVLAAH